MPPVEPEGKNERGSPVLAELPATNDQQRAQLIVAEAQLLRETGAYQKAFQLLSRGLDKFPDSPELLYDRALAAEKIGKTEVMEKDLRKLIQLKPDHAHAYNALGYGLAEHSNRLPEALELIEKAIQLSPNDPYIMDSLGWVHYRMGNLNQGLSLSATGIRNEPGSGNSSPSGRSSLGTGDKGRGERDLAAALKEASRQRSLAQHHEEIHEVVMKQDGGP